MMIADKKSIWQSTTDHYSIFVDSPEVDNRSADPSRHGYMGRLRGNFSETEYHMFGPGIKPKDKKS